MTAIDARRKTMRRVGGFNIAMGIVTLITGITIGVGCIVAGGNLIGKSDRD